MPMGSTPGSTPRRRSIERARQESLAAREVVRLLGALLDNAHGGDAVEEERDGHGEASGPAQTHLCARAEVSVVESRRREGERRGVRREDSWGLEMPLSRW